MKLELRYGASIDADYMSNVPFIRIENLRRNDLDLTNLKYVSSAVYGNQIKKLYLKEGDILIERSGTYVGLCSCVPEGLEDYVYGSYIIRLRLKNSEDILPEYLTMFLNSALGISQFDRLKTGALQFNINIQQIKKVLIPKPTIQVQQNIIEKVRANLTKAKQLREQYRERLEKTDRLIAEPLMAKLNLQIPKREH